MAEVPDERGFEDLIARITGAQNVKTYVVGLSNGVDDTAQIQAAIDSADDNIFSRVVFRDQLYRVNAAPRHDRLGNAIVSLPRNPVSGVMSLEGHPAGTVIRTDRTDGSYSGSFGPQSILGGPTKENGNTFGEWDIRMSNITVAQPIGQSPGGPTFAGLDLGLYRMVNLVRVGATVDAFIGNLNSAINKHTFGIRLPDGQNFGHVLGDMIYVVGYYCGLVLNTAHAVLRNVDLETCQQGLGLVGSGQNQNVDPHGSTIQYLDTEQCAHHIAGYDVVAGTQDIPVGKPFFLNIHVWDIQDGPVQVGQNTWSNTVDHIKDTNSQIFGRADFVRVLANSGIVSGPLTTSGSGALAFQTRDLTVPRPTAFDTTSLTTPPVTGVSQQNLSDHRLFVTIQYALAPTAGAAATIVGTIGPFGQSQFFQDSAPIGVANARNGTATFVLERGWLFNFTATNATLGQLRAVPLLG